MNLTNNAAESVIRLEKPWGQKLHTFCFLGGLVFFLGSVVLFICSQSRLMSHIGYTIPIVAFAIFAAFAWAVFSTLYDCLAVRKLEFTTGMLTMESQLFGRVIRTEKIPLSQVTKVGIDLIGNNKVKQLRLYLDNGAQKTSLFVLGPAWGQQLRQYEAEVRAAIEPCRAAARPAAV